MSNFIRYLSQKILITKEDFIELIEDYYTNNLMTKFLYDGLPTRKNEELIINIAQDMTTIVIKSIFGLIQTYHASDKEKRLIEIRRGDMSSAQGAIDFSPINRNIAKYVSEKFFSMIDSCINYDDFRTYSYGFLENKYKILKIDMQIKNAVLSTVGDMVDLDNLVIQVLSHNGFDHVQKKDIVYQIFPNKELKHMDAPQRLDLFKKYMNKWFIQKRINEEKSKHKTVAKHSAKQKIKI